MFCYPESCIVDWKKAIANEGLLTPIDWAAEFGNSQPLVIEIGTGNGMWLQTYARTHPDCNIIGVEWAGEYVRDVSKRCLRDGIQNVRLICGDARLLLPFVFGENLLNAAHIYFPDPWFKKRHKRRRVLNKWFFRMLIRKLAPESEIFIATDDADYYSYIVGEARAVAAMETVSTDVRHYSADGVPQTKYERKWRTMGREIYYLQLKNALNSQDDAISTEEYVMRQGLQYAYEMLVNKCSSEA